MVNYRNKFTCQEERKPAPLARFPNLALHGLSNCILHHSFPVEGISESRYPVVEATSQSRFIPQNRQKTEN